MHTEANAAISFEADSTKNSARNKQVCRPSKHRRNSGPMNSTRQRTVNRQQAYKAARARATANAIVSTITTISISTDRLMSDASVKADLFDTERGEHPVMMNCRRMCRPLCLPAPPPDAPSSLHSHDDPAGSQLDQFRSI